MNEIGYGTEFNGFGGMYRVYPQVASTLRTQCGGCNGSGVIIKKMKNRTAYPINRMVLGKELKKGDRQTVGIGDSSDPIPTLSGGEGHAVVIVKRGER